MLGFMIIWSEVWFLIAYSSLREAWDWKTKASEVSNVKCLCSPHPLFSCSTDGCGGRDLWLSGVLLIDSWCQTCFLPRDFGVAASSTASTSEIFVILLGRRVRLQNGLSCWHVFQVRRSRQSWGFISEVLIPYQLIVSVRNPVRTVRIASVCTRRLPALLLALSNFCSEPCACAAVLMRWLCLSPPVALTFLLKCGTCDVL